MPLPPWFISLWNAVGRWPLGGSTSDWLFASFRLLPRDGWLRVFYAIDDALCRVKRKRRCGISPAPIINYRAHATAGVPLCAFRRDI
jgi:hypothetical protein